LVGAAEAAPSLITDHLSETSLSRICGLFRPHTRYNNRLSKKQAAVGVVFVSLDSLALQFLSITLSLALGDHITMPRNASSTVETQTSLHHAVQVSAPCVHFFCV
jgi:hypothetical protein